MVEHANVAPVKTDASDKNLKEVTSGKTEDGYVTALNMSDSSVAVTISDVPYLLASGKADTIQVYKNGRIDISSDTIDVSGTAYTGTVTRSEHITDPAKANSLIAAFNSAVKDGHVSKEEFHQLAQMAKDIDPKTHQPDSGVSGAGKAAAAGKGGIGG